MARGRKPTKAGWSKEDLAPVQANPDAGSATRSAVRNVLSVEPPAANNALRVEGTSVRKGTLIGMPPGEAGANPSSATRGPIGRANTIAGVTGVGGGNNDAGRNAAVTFYDGAAAENAAADFQLFADAIGILEDAGIDRELGRKIALGEVSKENIPIVREILANVGVDEKTSLAVLWGRRILALPVITPPAALSPSPGNYPINNNAGKVQIDGSYAAAVDEAERTQDTAPFINTGVWKQRLLIGGIIAIGLGAVGYGVIAISNNVTHATSGSRR